MFCANKSDRGCANSYAGLSKTPSLTSAQLGKVIEGFNFDDKFNALQTLQSGVSDRAGLEGMIDDKFSYFDRDRARAIVGLPARNPEGFRGSPSRLSTCAAPRTVPGLWIALANGLGSSPLGDRLISYLFKESIEAWMTTTSSP